MFTVKSLLRICVVAFVFIHGLAFASNIDVNADINDVALQGYDSVAYFTKGKPTRGKNKFTVVHDSAVYKFSSKDNRDLFKENPEKYAPQFGGFCAMGVVLEKKLPTDPTAWKIVEGKLYLNLNKKVQGKWLTDTPTYIESANKLWPYLGVIPADEL